MSTNKTSDIKPIFNAILNPVWHLTAIKSHYLFGPFLLIKINVPMKNNYWITSSFLLSLFFKKQRWRNNHLGLFTDIQMYYIIDINISDIMELEYI